MNLWRSLSYCTVSCVLASACSKTPPEPASQPAATKAPPAAANSGAAAHKIADADITGAVRAGFGSDPGIDAKTLTVKTTDGIVELTGTADNILTGRRATQLAETIKGVRSVSDRITVKAKSRPDADLERDVKNALAFNADTSTFEIGVKVRNGSVTLTGTAHSHQAVKMAERMAESVKGVTAVDDKLEISSPATRPDDEIANDVRSVFRWDRLLNDGLLESKVKDGKVTLSGVVGSAAERRRAERRAWVNGVKGVDASAVQVEWWAKSDDFMRTKRARTSDADIGKAIRDATALDPRVQSAGIQTDVSSGVATLRGTVASARAKTAAQSLARNTVGVVDVTNLLEVKPAKPVPDKTITEHVASALVADPVLESFDVKVKATGGEVTLTGAVNSSFDRAEATEVTAGISGVRRVDNQLAIKRPEVAYVYSFYLDPYEPFIETWHYAPMKTTATDAQITTRIKSDLAFSPFVDSNQVKVAVDHGKATLTGSVDSYGESALATDDAFVGGAIAVENRLRVAPPGG